MTKIKIISNWNPDTTEYEVNSFIANHNVTSMQFQASGSSGSGRTYAVMIIYEE